MSLGWKPQRRLLAMDSKSTAGDVNDEDSSGDDKKELTLGPDLLLQIERRNKKFEARTRKWLEQVVVGMSLCPFAEKPIKENKLKIYVLRGDDLDVILPMVHAEMERRVEVPGTSLSKE